MRRRKKNIGFVLVTLLIFLYNTGAVFAFNDEPCTGLNYEHCLPPAMTSTSGDWRIILEDPVYVDGKFKLLGRADHVIISGGLKIHPEEIESKLSGILNCNYMIGSIKDDKLGERLILYIEKGDNNERLIFTIWEEIEQVLQKHEIPKEIVFVPEIFKTTSGKTDRNRLLDQYQ